MGVGTPSYDSAGIKYIPVEIPGTNFFPSSNNPSPSTSSMFRPYTPSPVDTRTILQNIAASPPPPFYPEPLPGFGRPQFKSPADSLVKNIPGLQVFGGNGTTSNIPAIPNILYFGVCFSKKLSLISSEKASCAWPPFMNLVLY